MQKKKSNQDLKNPIINERIRVGYIRRNNQKEKELDNRCSKDKRKKFIQIMKFI